MRMRWPWIGRIGNCWPHFSKLGSYHCRPRACGPWSAMDPNFSKFRSAFTDTSSPGSPHCPIVLVRSFGLACPDSSVLTGTEVETVVYRGRNVTVLANTVTFFHNLTVLIECGESGEGASINAYLILRHWGPMQTKGPQGPRFALKTLMSKNEVRIYGCARARLTAFTLLLG